MQGLIFNIRSFSVHDGPGIRQTIFFKGCPLNCSWCHNPESRNSKQEVWTKTNTLSEKKFKESETIGRWVSVDDLMIEVLKDVPFFEESGGGVTLSGGEPLAQADFTKELLKICKEKGIHTAIDTSGYARSVDMEKIIPFTDLFLFDLKIIDNQKHFEHTGKGNELILNNLKLLSAANKKIHIRIPLVENVTDLPENLEAIKEIILNTRGIERIDLLPYHFSARNKYERLKKEYTKVSKEEYPPEKAFLIKDFFQNLTPVLSIGG
jgi:pyruvate formate lyase activating enzyme